MSIDHKIIIFIVASIFFASAIISAHSVYENKVRMEAYRECIAANERIAEKLSVSQNKAITISSIPTCYMR